MTTRHIIVRDTRSPTIGAKRTFRTGLACLGRKAERHYLPFDGVNHYGMALNAVTGVEDEGTPGEYCFLLKLNSASYGMNKRAGGLTDTSGSPSNIDFGGLAAFVFSSASTLYRQAVQSFSRAAANEGSAAVTFGTPDKQCVIAHNYANAPLAARGIFARAGVSVSVGNYTPSTVRHPEHVGIGTSIWTTGVASTVALAAIKWVSCVVLNRWPSEAEVASYSTLNVLDARDVWETSAIRAYWTASDTSGTSVPPRIGTVPLTLVGGIGAGDLVSL